MVDADKYQEKKKKSSYLADGEWAVGCMRMNALVCGCVGVQMRGCEDALTCGCVGEQTRMNVKKKELTKQKSCGGCGCGWWRMRLRMVVDADADGVGCGW